MADAMNDDDDLDRAFRAALASAAPAEDPAAVQRRRQAVLAAVDAALVPAPTLPVASNEPQWAPLSPWWRGAAAASVLVCSALLVARLAQEPAAPTPLPPADMTAPPAAPAASTATLQAPAAEAPAPPPPRQEALRRRPAPPAPVERSAAPQDRVTEMPPVSAAAPAPRALSRAAGAEHPPFGQLKVAPAAAAAIAPAPGLLAWVLQGDTEAVQRILAQRGPDNERDADGRTALTLAVLQANPAMVSLLLQHGADRLATDRFGQTAQGYAAASGDPALLKAFGLAP